VTALSTLNGGRLTIVEGREPALFQQPVFAHFRVGTNRDPLSKFRDFSAVIKGGVGEQVDVAFLKLCYVDVGAQTDVKNVFAAYQDMMESLRERYPKVVFLYVTVPLRRVGSSFWGWLRETTGGIDRELEDQARRHAFNQLLRGMYARSGRLFDLAEEEATLQDGMPSSFRYRGEAVQNLVSDYTDDGGHLNRSAAEHIAGRLAVRLIVVR
jgi:hypothetical protein